MSPSTRVQSGVPAGGQFSTVVKVEPTLELATVEDDWDEDACSTEGCDGRLDDGEGSDGRCGNCADALTCPVCEEDAKDDSEDPMCRECAREAARVPLPPSGGSELDYERYIQQHGR